MGKFVSKQHSQLLLAQGCNVDGLTADERRTRLGGLPNIRKHVEPYIYQKDCKLISFGSLSPGLRYGVDELISGWKAYNQLKTPSQGTTNLYTNTFRELDQLEQAYLQLNYATTQAEYQKSMAEEVDEHILIGAIVLALYILFSGILYYIAYLPYLRGLQNDICILQSFLLLMPMNTLYSFENQVLGKCKATDNPNDDAIKEGAFNSNHKNFDHTTDRYNPCSTSNGSEHAIESKAYIETYQDVDKNKKHSDVRKTLKDEIWSFGNAAKKCAGRVADKIIFHDNLHSWEQALYTHEENCKQKDSVVLGRSRNVKSSIIDKIVKVAVS